MKKTGATISDLERWIQLVCKFSSKKISSFDCSTQDKEYTLDDLVFNLGISSIA